MCHGLGSGFSKVVSVGAEHRHVVIITTVIVSTLQGGATCPLRVGMDRAGVAEGLRPGEGSAARRERPPPPPTSLAEGLDSCVTGPGQLVGGWGHGAARRETLASGQHSSQIRP